MRVHGQGLLIFPLGIALSVSGCMTASEKTARDDGLRAATHDCMNRESAAVAPQKVDLNTAAVAVLARCAREINAQDEALLHDFPGYQEFILPKLRELQQARLDRVRSLIALERTKG